MQSSQAMNSNLRVIRTALYIWAGLDCLTPTNSSSNLLLSLSKPLVDLFREMTVVNIRIPMHITSIKIANAYDSILMVEAQSC